ncbi:MAG TPA: methyltransferase domain-containing protein [Solirubrobacterales bacterium]|jgi:trans-aconitate 2-methyltransferase|nr:methyltransferase domain-containing protein [Solirubrobacterales bacterium]
MNSGPREWDAETYDAISDPQFSWGLEVLERLELQGDETVLDAGCGSGKVTAELAKRLPRGRIVAVDASQAMIAKARERLGEGASYVVADLSELQVDEPVDLIFSTATFHWVLDHERLFARLAKALRPGGSLVAQCGGQGNVAGHALAIATVATQSEFSPYFEGMTLMWNFASPEETEVRLAAAGFAEPRCWLEPKPVTPERPLEFTSTVTLGPHLARLPEDLRRPFAERVLDLCPRPLTLDYVRLNIEAKTPLSEEGAGRHRHV